MSIFTVRLMTKYVKETIDFLLNREEAHNALFREAFTKVRDTGSNVSFGVTRDSRLYFDLNDSDKKGDCCCGDTVGTQPVGFERSDCGCRQWTEGKKRDGRSRSVSFLRLFVHLRHGRRIFIQPLFPQIVPGLLDDDAGQQAGPKPGSERPSGRSSGRRKVQMTPRSATAP